jgi:hypothetical protein
MELDLTDIGQTLAIGSVVVVGFGAWLYLLLDIPVTPRLAVSDKSPFRLAASAVLIAALFAVGILAEDVSKDVVGKQSSLRPTLPSSGWLSSLRSILPPDDELQAEGAFTRSEDGGKVAWSPHPVAKRLAERQIFQRYGSDEERKQGRELEDKILHASKNASIGQDEVVRATARVYSQAHAILPQQDKYYTELRRIESRADFTRSFCFACLLLLGIGFVILIARMLMCLVSLLRQASSLSAGTGCICTGLIEIARGQNYIAIGRKYVSLRREYIAIGRQYIARGRAGIRAGLSQIAGGWPQIQLWLGQLFPTKTRLIRCSLFVAALLIGFYSGRKAFIFEQRQHGTKVLAFWAAIHEPSFGGPFAPTTQPKNDGSGRQPLK